MTEFLSLKVTAPTSLPRSDARRAVGFWLLGCCAMVVVMVLLGGITRLTDSGLSIMEWKPLMGMLPPLTDQEWERVFALYRQIDEYRHVNAGMTMEGFKGIFWWEYLHRLWGRLIGVAFLLPLLWFTFRGVVGRRELPRLSALFLLGGLQGAAGWFMVASGFGDRVDVSQYRLVIHLMLAVAIYALMLWSALDYLAVAPTGGNQVVSKAMLRHARVMNMLIALEIALGGLTAGTDAGFVYNDFPLMNGRWLSPDLFQSSPWWVNFTENLAMIQFQHRLMAGIVVLAVVSLFVRMQRADIAPQTRRRSMALPVVLAAQAGLGIATLMFVVPVPLAVLHQLGAFALLGCGLLVQHGLTGASLSDRRNTA